MEVKIVIRKHGVKRSGVSMIDALIAIVIVFVIISVLGVITFAYSSTVDSAGVSMKFNEFCDNVDSVILEHTLDPSLPDLGNLLSAGGVVISENGHSIHADITQIPDELTIGRRHVPVRIHMIQQP